MNTYPLLRSLLFRFDPEFTHTITKNILRIGAGTTLGRQTLQRLFVSNHPALMTKVNGITFPNPLGLAAGFDKDGTAVNALNRLGFGFIEIGTVTPQAQPGNPRPRLFRLPQDQALINRDGFTNPGCEQVALTARSWQRNNRPIGINIGKQRYTELEHAPTDYATSWRRLATHADYMVINISSPNTPNLRRLQQPAALEAILAQLEPLRQLSPYKRVPLWLKLAPDETEKTIAGIATLCLRYKVDGIVTGNTSVQRPSGLLSSHRHEAGGLSGKPLAAYAQTNLALLHDALQGSIPLIAVGGIDSAASAYARIVAGASLCQLYTGWIYHGLALPNRILTGLVELLQRDGYTNLAQAIGAQAKR